MSRPPAAGQTGGGTAPAGGVLRRVVPVAIVPLAVLATGLSAGPWLRAFPADVLAVPLFGAAVLAILVPLVVVGAGLRRLWASAAVDLVLAVFYELLVTLRSPLAFDRLWDGVVHGPSQILTFALPLVSPRSLLVVPVALTWLAGAVVGECLARAWHTVVPYAVLLVTFGLAYGATTRAVTSSATGRRQDTLLAGGLLLTLLLVRAAQAWVGQDRAAETTQSDSRLPLRSVVIGVVVSLVAALAAAGAVQSDAFTGAPTTAARVPPLNRGAPLTPVSFINSLRPADATQRGAKLFTVAVDRPTSNYVAIATVDVYDGRGWSFARTFRPSGGVLPQDQDPTLRPHTAPVTQQYSLEPGAMTTVPWMPYLDRPAQINGVNVDIDSDSGMIVPARRLTGDSSYSVTSRTSDTPFTDLPAGAVPSLAGDPVDVQLPGAVSNQLTPLVSALATETGVSSARPLAYLQAVTRDFRGRYALSGAAPSASSAAAPSSGTPSSRTPSSSRRTSGRSSAGASSAATSSQTGRRSFGGTSFADVLASIRQNRSATPEQYATLTALLARKIGVRARLVTGFRVTPPRGAAGLPQGRYAVTASEAWTWVEVPITNVGWVALDSAPGSYAPTRPDSASAVPTRSASPTPSRSVQLSRAARSTGGGNAVAPRSDTGNGAGTSGATVVLLVLGGVVLLIALILVALLLRKRLRVRRRALTGDPRRRLLGAWQETLDVLAESGAPDLEACTSSEVAQVADARFGGEAASRARYLGEAANAALFGTAGWVGQHEADAAWQAHRVLRRSVRRQLTVAARVTATLRYHRPVRRTPVVGPTSWTTQARERGAELAVTRRRRAGHRRARRAR